MIGIVVEPSTVAVGPDWDGDAAAVSRWLRLLLDLHNAMVELPQLTLTAPRNLVNSLALVGLYPIYPNISSLMEQTGLGEVFGPGDVSRVVQSVLERVVAPGVAFGIMDVLYDRVETDPTLKGSGRYLTITKEIEESVALLACSVVLKHGFAAVFLSSWLGAQSGASKIAFTCRLLDWELSSNCGSTDYPGDPVEVESSTYLFADKVSALNCCDALEAWSRSRNADDIWLAIAMRAIQIAEGDERAFTELPRFVVGDQFISSAERWQAGSGGAYASVTLETCARVVANVEAEIQPFRSSTASTAPQRVREDGASAFRIHLSKAKVALRLMLWRLPDGRWEFANVGGKNELWIA